MAEAMPSMSAQYIERLLECAICLDRFTTPKLLPCQHTFCCDCLVGLVDHKRNCLRCPSCRVFHRVPSKGVAGYHNNLTITALLDIPTPKGPDESVDVGEDVNKEPTQENQVQEQEESPPAPCAECGSVCGLVCCFHCDRNLCRTCRECHKQSTQEEIVRDLAQIKQNIAKFSGSLQAMKANTHQVQGEKNVVKSQLWNDVDAICRELREKGFAIANQIDRKYQSRIDKLQRQAENIEVRVAGMDSFHTFTAGRMRESALQLSETELLTAMNQCSRFLGRGQPFPRIPRERRQGVTPSKNKPQSGSSSGSRSKIHRPTMKRLQSLPEMETMATTSCDPAPAQSHPTSNTLPIPSSERRRSLSPRPQFSLGVTPEEPMPDSPVAMDTSDRNPVPENVMPVDILDNTFTDRETDPSQSTTQPYSQMIVKAVIGKRGPRSWNPSAICISPINGTIIVVDSYRDCVQVLDRDGHFLTSYGTSGSTDGHFDYPTACVCMRDGNIIIADAFNHRVQILDKYGNFKHKFGQYGSQRGQLEGPSGVAFDSNGYIYVVDTNNYRIQVFDPEGGQVQTFGTPDNLPSTMQQPRYSCIMISPGGEVFVSDVKNHCVHVFNYTCKYVKSIGRQGSGLGEFTSPRGLALDQSGQLLVADRDNHRVQVFLQSGEFLYGFGSQGERAGQFQTPEGVAVAENGDIVVAECGGQRIQIFSVSSGTVQ